MTKVLKQFLVTFSRSSLVHREESLDMLNLTIDHLDLSYNRLGEGGAFMFFDALFKTTNPKLKEINLAGNGITNKGIDPLTEALNHGTSLVTLDLSHNLLTWNSLKKIGEKLEHSRSLKVLNLSGNIGIRSNQTELKEFLMTTVTMNEETDIICSPFSKVSKLENSCSQPLL